MYRSCKLNCPHRNRGDLFDHQIVFSDFSGPNGYTYFNTIVIRMFIQTFILYHQLK